MKDIRTTNRGPLILPADLSPEKVFEFNELVRAAIDTGMAEITIDCSMVENASSSHIGILWKTYDICNSANVKLTLAETTTGLVRVLYILDLGDLFGLGAEKESNLKTDKSQSKPGSRSYVHSELIVVSKEQLKLSTDELLNFLRKYNVPEMTIFELRTLFYEIMVNIIDHSGLTENDNVRFTATLIGNSIKLVFEDLGMEFDPTVYEGSGDLADLVAAAKVRRFKGFGLLMIRKFVDNISYTRKEEIMNCLEIEKHWS